MRRQKGDIRHERVPELFFDADRQVGQPAPTSWPRRNGFCRTTCTAVVAKTVVSLGVTVIQSINERRFRVGIVYGGRGNEHGISCASAGNILRNLDPRRFDAIAIGISTEGSWVCTPADPERLTIRAGQLPRVTSSSGTVVSPEEALASVDVVFPFAEDSNIQGLLELTGLPYVGGGVFAIAAGMDKEFAKKLLAAEGLPIVDHVVLRPHQDTVQPGQLELLGLPVFVKPARSGSSIGVSPVTKPDQLPAAIAEARQHDMKVIVEAAVRGRELECGLLEFPDGTIAASAVGEIRVEGGLGREDGFYDFTTKYLDEVSHIDVPANIDDDVRAAVQELAIRAFNAIDCQGLARVDFFLTDKGLLVNEINTIPGFTRTSMYQPAWAAAGVDYRTLLSTMVDTALVRGGLAALERRPV